jgi:hypothetical protein
MLVKQRTTFSGTDDKYICFKRSMLTIDAMGLSMKIYMLTVKREFIKQNF